MEYDVPMKPYGPTAGRDHIEDKPRPENKKNGRFSYSYANSRC